MREGLAEWGERGRKLKGKENNGNGCGRAKNGKGREKKKKGDERKGTERTCKKRCASGNNGRRIERKEGRKKERREGGNKTRARAKRTSERMTEVRNG